MAKYEMREMPDVRKTGQHILYPKMKVNRQVTTDELCRNITAGSTLTPADIKATIDAVAHELARQMADGNSVKLDGIGTFSARLGLNEEAERETIGEDKPRRNAQSIRVTGVNFRCDNNLIGRTHQQCDLVRDSSTGRLNTSSITKEEGLKLALTYLESHPYLTVIDYMQMTGKKRGTATLELREFANDPQSGLIAQGSASHRVYVKKA